MKFQKQGSIQGNLGTRKRCEFDTEAVGHLMAMFSNIYSDSKTGVLREYAANGLDSHRAAGVSLPVEVVLPTELSPELVISDCGLGLDADGIDNVFASYGASTKRDSNSDIGGFGIGAKSAFTISGQFTVDAVKDGVQVVEVFSLDGSIPGHTTIHTGPTERGNGVQVRIPVPLSDIDQWADKAAQCFATWPRGSVLVDGEEPASLFDECTKVTDGVWLSPRRMPTYFTAVVGGVSYSGGLSIAKSVTDLGGMDMAMSSQFVVELPIGSVDIAPNRESLRDTRRTIEAVSDAFRNARKSIEAGYKEAIDRATTSFEVALAWSTHNAEYGCVSHLFCRPQTLPGVAETGCIEVTGNPRASRRSYRVPVAVLSTTLSDSVVVTGGIDGSLHRMLPRWRKANGYPRVILAGEKEFLDWIPVSAFANIITASELIEQAKGLPPVTSAKSRTPESEREYRVRLDDSEWGTWTAQEVLDEVGSSGREVLTTSSARSALGRLADMAGEFPNGWLLISGHSHKWLNKGLGYTPGDVQSIWLRYAQKVMASATEEELQFQADRRWVGHQVRLDMFRTATGRVRAAIDTALSNAEKADPLVSRLIDQGSLVVTTPLPPPSVRAFSPTLELVLGTSVVSSRGRAIAEELIRLLD